MKIYPVLKNSVCQLNTNERKNVVSTTRQPVSDCFVKTGNVSFSAVNLKSKRAQTVDSYTRDLASKMRKSNLTLADISNSMRKYVKNVSIKPMNEAPKNVIFSKDLQGIYCEEVKFNPDAKRCYISKNDKVFYCKTETFDEMYGDVAVFVNAVHEFTHILQSEDSSINHVSLFNKYLEKNKVNISDAIKQINVTTKVINPIEENIARHLIDILISDEDAAYDYLKSGNRNMLSWICKKANIKDFGEYVKNKTDKTIKAYEKQFKINLDKSLVYTATIKQFEKEIEAYENQNKAFKMCAKIDSVRAMARIQIYQRSIEFLKQMQRESNY